jgi:hypothetical protein
LKKTEIFAFAVFALSKKRHLVKILKPKNWFLLPRISLFKSGRESGWPGVDVMITIFCDFCQFSQKPMLWSKFLQSLALLWVKTPIFRNFFQRKYFKNQNISTRCFCEKIAQNVAPPRFLSNLLRNFYFEENSPQILATSFTYLLKKLSKDTITQQAQIRPIWSPW